MRGFSYCNLLRWGRQQNCREICFHLVYTKYTSGGDLMDYSVFVKSMLEYVEKRVKEELPPKEVAQAAGFSHSHFRTIFKSLVGMSLAKYINLRKLNHAAFEIMHSKKSILDIALNYAYNSHDAFSRAFKREFGETPTEFRKNKRFVGGKLIVPGIFGPQVYFQEEKKMTIANTKDDCILYGVPKVTYFGNNNELTPFISSLRACLSYLGQNISYAQLMVASGAAFRLLWNTKCWDGGNVDILCMRENPLEPIIRAVEAAGREFELLVKKDSLLYQVMNDFSRPDVSIRQGERKDFWQLIDREINAGRPLIAFGIVGPPEACIITGYRDGGQMLTGWNFFQEMPEFAGDLSYEPCGYFTKSNWYEHPDTCGIMAIGEKSSQFTEQVSLQEILEYALDIMKSEKVQHRASSFCAFSAWEQALLRDNEFPLDAPLPMLVERLMCQCDAMTMIAEGRKNAAEFFQEMSESTPEVATEMKAVVHIFHRECQIVVKQMGKILEGFAMGEIQARNLGNREKRVKIARLVSEICQQERKALEKMESALRKF